MNTTAILAFVSAIFGGAMALTVAWYERRSIAHWAFVAGMAALATEGLFLGLSAGASSLKEMVVWQNWRLLALSFLPGTWLFSV